jgi:hypothetical protein
MKSHLLPALCFPLILGIHLPMCPAPEVRPTVPPDRVDLSELWTRPADIGAQDLYYGPWGRDYAPDPSATYRFVKSKIGGGNPGMTVEDPDGREWNVKQPYHDRSRGPEGPVEVVASRILAAVGYRQPPVYFLPTFRLRDTFGARTEPGGRFRLDLKQLEDRGPWQWQQNPFVGTRPYNGLLAILMMINSSDLKNSNNTLYEYRAAPGRTERWFVVRDLGIGLGATGRVRPPYGDVEAFEAHGFITGVEHGFVVFDYRGYHEELIRQRITPEDVRWAGDLLGELTYRQWHEAFRAGGFDEETARRFVTRLQLKVTVARNLGDRLEGVPVGE